MSGGPREIFDCERVRAYLDSFLEGQVPPPEARAIRLHFLRCEACYSRIVGREPLQLFAPLALAEDPGDEAFWEDLWPAVRAGIREPEPRRHGILALLRGPTLAWSAAAALLVVAVLAFVRPWEPGRAGSVVPAPPPAAVRDTIHGAWSDIQAASGSPSLPTVEEVRSPTAKVLSMKVVGEDRAVTEVVLIVDEGIDL